MGETIMVKGADSPTTEITVTVSTASLRSALASASLADLELHSLLQETIAAKLKSLHGIRVLNAREALVFARVYGRWPPGYGQRPPGRGG